MHLWVVKDAKDYNHPILIVHILNHHSLRLSCQEINVTYFKYFPSIPNNFKVIQFRNTQ